MHKVFGVKEKAEYTDREGAYLIPFRGNLQNFLTKVQFE